MLMVRFGKGVVMNTLLTILKTNQSNANQSFTSVDSKRSNESFTSAARNRIIDRVYAIPRVSLKNNSSSDTFIIEKIKDLNKRSSILDKMILLHFPKSMDTAINISQLGKKLEQENDLMEHILKENNRFFSITNGIQHSNIKEKNEILNEIDNNLTGSNPSQFLLQFISKNKSNYISKL